jgi:plasmid maintenance system antidote protein VapI
VNGKRAITADTALRLERYFGIEAQFWLNLQTEFDLRTTKRKIWADIEKRIIPAKHTSESIPQNASA